jgi:2-dehydropantoate 2-reductase
MESSQNRMAICIYGAGAIGLDLGVNLIAQDHRVTFIARGVTLDALRSSGIVYHTGDSLRELSPREFSCTADPHSAGPQNYVFLTVKADALLDISESIPPLLHPGTVVVSATNGIPPWYSHLQDHTIGRYLQDTEPRERFFRSVPSAQIVGALIQRSVTRHGPNAITHTAGTGYEIGELDHKIEGRTLALKRLLEDAGFTVTLSEDIHRDVWIKLLGNICVNPLSVITGRTIGEMLDDTAIRRRMELLVEETHEVGLRLGVIEPGDFALDDFLSFADAHLRDHETSMLQHFKRGSDLETHRMLEIVITLGELKGIEAPISQLKSVLDEIREKLLARTTGP